jgi:hypothetical protein
MDAPVSRGRMYNLSGDARSSHRKLLCNGTSENTAGQAV